MTERDELPEGWRMRISTRNGVTRPFWASRFEPFNMTGHCASEQSAIAAAWRIVDAEKEAADGQ